VIGLAGSSLAQTPPRLIIAGAGPGSAFLPYAMGIAALVEASGAAKVEVRESKGSIENLALVEASPTTLGTVFLGSAHEAITGTGFAAGKPHTQVRALFPMYETSFQLAARKGTGVKTARDLDGKRVGTGPQGGPAEGYFRALAAEIGISPQIVSGTPTELVDKMAKGEIDALWQGAVVPVPALVDAVKRTDAVVFGLTPEEVAALRKRYPFMAEAVVPPNTYPGQAERLLSVAAWNFVVANANLPDDVAYAVTKAVLESSDRLAKLGAPGRGTQAEEVRANTVAPFHPGALRYYREKGVKAPGQ